MYDSESLFIFCNMKEDICWGVYSLSYTLNLKSVPILRFAAITVPSGLVTICLLAGSPTSNWPSFINATYDGKAFPPIDVPSAACIIVGFPPIMTEAAELLVPRSIPIILPIIYFPYSLSFTLISLFVTVLLDKMMEDGLKTLLFSKYPFLITSIIVLSGTNSLNTKAIAA